MFPLRGRSDEVSVLQELARTLEHGAGGVVVVEGAAGLGKTRLLSEMAAFARARGISLLSGAADEQDPVSPWRALTRALAGDHPSILAATHLGSAVGRLDHRLAVIENVRVALQEASRQGPLLVMLDDLHWADAATLLAVATLPEQLFSYPVGWVLTHRPVLEGHPVKQVSERLQDAGAVTVHLQPLRHAATLELASDILGEPADPTMLGLLAAAGGNPFYIEELLRPTTVDQGMGIDPATAIEQAGRSVVEAHLRGLDEEVLRLLELGSVLGREFSVTEIAVTSGQNAGRWLGALERAQAAEMVVESGEELSFRHDLLRQAVYAQIPSDTRKTLHRDAGRGLQRLGAPITRVAGHYVRGAEPGDEQAIEALTAAVRALATSAPGTAAEMALRLVELLPPSDPRRAPMTALAVDMLGWVGRVEQARDIGERLLAEGPCSPQLEATIQLGIRRSWVLRMMTAYPTALPAGLVTDTRISAGTRAALIITDVWRSFDAADFKTAETELDTAEQLATEAVDDTEVVTTLSSRLTCDTLQGQVARGLRRLDHGIPGTQPLTSPVAVGHVHSLRAQSLRALGRLEAAEEAVSKACMACEESGVTHILCWARSIRARLLYDRGRLEDAVAEAREVVGTAERFDCALEYAAAAMGLILEVALLQGERAAAELAAARLSAIPQVSVVMTDRHWALALARADRGDPAGALELMGPVFAQMSSGFLPFARWNTDRLPRIVRLALRAGDDANAALVTRCAAEYARLNPEAPLLGMLAAHAQGLLASDARILGEAVSGLAGSPLPMAEATAREDLGLVLAAQGDIKEAAAQLDTALAAYAALGAHREAARVRGQLLHLGVRQRRRPASRPAAGWESLTPSELNVVEIVAGGLTNAAAAAQLFLSPDTVNTHLRHAFAKLGVRSRMELTGLVLARQTARGDAQGQ